VVALTLVVARPASADTLGDEAQFLSSLNGLRTAKGLKALKTHTGLVEVARAWARTMAAAGSISHNGSLGSQGPSEWERLGENMGMGMEVQSVHDAFVASPSHYKNMVDAGFDSVGIGVVRNADNVLYVTVNFMQVQAAAAPAPAPAAPAPAPAPAPVKVAVPAPVPAKAPAPAPAPVPAPVAAAVPAPAPAVPAATPVVPVEPVPVAAAPVEPVAAAPVSLATRPAAAVSRGREPVTPFQVALLATAALLGGALVVVRRPAGRPAFA
ncbi:MAG: CAP domain-containing protein, partial [Acidimicrobiia bacterium]